jgi:serine protease
VSSTPRSAVGLAVVITVAALITPVGAAAAAPSTRDHVPAATHRTVHPLPTRHVTRLVIRTTDGKVASSAVRSAAATSLGVNRAPVLRRLATGSTLVGLSSAVSLADAWKTARALTARADVAYAEPDVWMFPTDVSPVVPSDPRFADQWDLWDSTGTAGGWSSRAPNAWSRTVGKPEVVVAVLDTGLTVHPDISSSVTAPSPGDPVVPGYDFVSLDNVSKTATPDLRPLTANDGDGRDPDPSDPGDWITASEDAGTDGTGWFTACGTSNSSWHGTHVTGTVVARQGNGVGVSGIAPGVKVQPVRVLGKCGGYMSDISDAVTWASGGSVSGVPANETPATVINMSLGGVGACATTMSDAIAGARARGTTVVVAAGNGDANGDGVSITPTPGSETNTGAQPADCPGVVVVAATDRAGHVARYSNVGTSTNPITVAAPGGAGTGGADDILSTLNSGTTTPQASPDGFYQYYAGTSMATPHVAAAVALLQSQLTVHLKPDAVAARLAETARPVASLPGCTRARCGAGLLDVGAVLGDVPSAPAEVDAAAGDASVDLLWTPSSPRGTAVTGYHVQGSIGGGAWLDVVADTTATATELTVTQVGGTPLVNGQPYSFRVSGINEIGESSGTESAAITPSRIPAPSRVAAPAVTGGVEQLDPIAWTAPSSSVPITGYSVRYRRVGSSGWTCAGGASGCITPSNATRTAVHTWPTALPAGTYEVQVAAVNATGRGLFSPSGTAAVTALSQRAALSGSVLRPFRDGFQDTVRIEARSNTPASGTLRILNSRGAVVLVVPLARATAWTYSWAGLTSRRARVPNGTYRAQVALSGRSAARVALAALTITVASSQASRPTIVVSTSTVFPYVDRYKDTMAIRTTAGVPARFSWKLLRSGRTVWAASFRSRPIASGAWAGLSSARAKLPTGLYTLVVTATGGEGRAVASSRTVGLSWQHLRAQRFSVDRAAAGSAPVALNGTLDLPGSGEVNVQGGQVITFAPVLPTSVNEYSGLTVEACTTVGGEPGAEVYLQYMSGPTSFIGLSQGPLGNDAGRCYYNSTVTGQAPAASVWLGRVHFALGNTATTPVAFYVSAFRITGYRYYLA